MNSEWQAHELGQLTKFKYGKFLAKSELDVAGFEVFSGYGVVGYLPTYQFEDPQLLIVCRGEGGTGDVKMSPAKCSITNLAIVLTPNEATVSKKFLYWALKASDTHRLRTGSAQAQIVIGSLERFSVAIPSDLVLQQEIVWFLDALDDRITLLRETNATLEAIAQALFKSWFVDFDPVRAKMEGRAPEGMDEATAALFPDGLEESELGAVPRGWRIGTLADLMRLHKGSVNPSANPDKQFQHFSLPSFDAGQMPVMELGEQIKSNKTTVPSEAVLLSKLNPHVPRIWLPSAVGGDAVCSTEFLPRDISTTALVFCVLSAPNFSTTLCQLVTGTSNSHQRIKPDGVLSLPSVIPPAQVIATFDAVVCELLASVKGNRETIQTLATLRDTLLPRLISGQLRMPTVLADMETSV